MIYYAHSKRIYNTKREELERQQIEKVFHTEIVMCPNRDMGELGSMEPYLKKVRACSIIVCSEYDDHIGRGVYEEVLAALNSKKKVYCIRYYSIRSVIHIVRSVKLVDPYDWTIRYGKLELGKKL